MADSSSLVERVEESGEGVLELDSWDIRSFYSIWLPDCRISEIRVDCNTEPFEFSNMITDSEACKPSICEILLGNIIRKL